jgi:hypothetical protein
MFENWKKSKIAEGQTILSRRNFIIGGAAVAGVIAVDSLQGNKESSGLATEIPHDERLDIEMSNANVEQYNELSDSGYFNADVARYASEYEEQVAVVYDNADTYASIQECFLLPDIESKLVRSNLEALAPSLGFVESRYQNVVSKVKAFGVMQIMPATWDELSREGESRDNVEDQIKVAARLMEQAYQHITSTKSTELQIIKDRFFAGDSADFDNCFLTPLVLNAYNAGMGSMSDLVGRFLELCPTPKETVELFEQSETLTGFDVFIGMAHTAELQGWVDWYKEVASNYTCRVYGAHEACHKFVEDKNNI